MKKYLYVLSLVLLAVVGCNKFVEEKPLAPDSVVNPNVLISEVGDSTFTATITAKEGTGFYSFVVMEGTPKKLSASSVLKCSNDGLSKGTVDFSKDKEKVVVMKKLIPNSKYTVYAVAASVQGQTSEVVAVEVLTTDLTNPAFKNVSADTENAAFTITCNDVMSKTGEGRAWAHYYCVDGSEDHYLQIPDENITVSGKSITFEFPEYIDGATLGLEIEAGMFQNGVGKKIGGLAAPVFKDGKFSGVTMALETKAWNIKDPMLLDQYSGKMVRMPEDTVLYYTDALDVEMYFIADSAAFDVGEDFSLKLNYLSPNGRSLSFYVSEFGFVDDTTGLLWIQEEGPNFGDVISFYVGENSIIDKWGNPNAEYACEGHYMLSFGYSREDVIGTYTFTGWGDYGDEIYEENIVIAPWGDTEEEETDSVVVYGWGNSPILYEYYGDFTFDPYAAVALGEFDGDAGVLTLVPYDYFGTFHYDYDGLDYDMWHKGNGVMEMPFFFPEPGVGHQTDYILEMMDFEGESAGYWDAYVECTFTRVSEEYKIPERPKAESVSPRVDFYSNFINLTRDTQKSKKFDLNK